MQAGERDTEGSMICAGFKRRQDMTLFAFIFAVKLNIGLRGWHQNISFA